MASLTEAVRRRNGARIHTLSARAVVIGYCALLSAAGQLRRGRFGHKPAAQTKPEKPGRDAEFLQTVDPDVDRAFT
jgi:hypothetical protein